MQLDIALAEVVRLRWCRSTGRLRSGLFGGAVLKIYMAGLSSLVSETAPDLMVIGKAKPQHVLESYYYLKSPAKFAKVRERGTKIFLDSGAYSMHTKGVKVDLKKFAQCIYTNRDMIEVAANLDAIGGANGAADSYHNLKKLEGMLLPQGLAVLPVHHVRDDDYWIQRYLDEGYPHICLGGMVPESSRTLPKWLDHIWSKYLLNPDGTAKVKVHGFGLTSSKLMFGYPFYSVDSTSWMSSRYGSCFLDIPQSDGTMMDIKVDFSSRSAKLRRIGSWHYERLSEPHRKKISDRLEQLEANRVKDPEFEARLECQFGFKPGWNPTAFAKSYGWRANFNIHYFERLQSRRVRHSQA
jgi:hypothetical protein